MLALRIGVLSHIGPLRAPPVCRHVNGRYDTMSLSLFAAETLVNDYLNGRVLPEAVHGAVVLTTGERLIRGLVPVLNKALCAEIEKHATATPPWTAESVLRAAHERQEYMRVPGCIGTGRSPALWR